MTGRNLFRRIKPALKAVDALARLLPRGMFSHTWFLIENFPGHIGILLRYIFLKRLARSCGDNVMIGRRCTLHHWEGLTLGDNVTIHVNCYIDAIGGVRIGSNVSIAHATSILSFEHSWSDPSVPIKYNELVLGAVEIGDDVWVGCGVRLLSGARIGTRTVIAAGAVVRKGDYSGGIFGGVPATCLKQFS